ncbi:helix-turn-helix domain-containing protein [Spirosoma gilvum]
MHKTKSTETSRTLLALDEELIDSYKDNLLKAVTLLAETENARQKFASEAEASRLMTPAEAQAYLKCSHDSLSYYRRFGLDPYKKGKDVWYTKAMIDAWLATGRVNRRK